MCAGVRCCAVFLSGDIHCYTVTQSYNQNVWSIKIRPVCISFTAMHSLPFTFSTGCYIAVRLSTTALHHPQLVHGCIIKFCSCCRSDRCTNKEYSPKILARHHCSGDANQVVVVVRRLMIPCVLPGIQKKEGLETKCLREALRVVGCG